MSLTYFLTVQKLHKCLPLCTGQGLNVGASICRNRTNALWNCPFHNIKTNEDNKYIHSMGLVGLLTCLVGLN